MKKTIKAVLIIAAVLLGAVLIWFLYSASRPAVPANYASKVTAGGEVEQKYLQNGSYEVAYLEQSVMQYYQKYEIYYPAELEASDRKWPVIVMCNGTGVKASKYPALFEHLASWGFIVIGTEDEYTWNGFSADMSLNYLLKNNENTDSIFYQKVDTGRIGITGHSQGGVAVINAITDTKHAGYYKAAFALSPTHELLAEGLEWSYDLSKVTIPFAMVAGTGKSDAELVITPEGMQQMYEHLTNAPLKVMARKTDREHGEMLYEADGYVTAWFLWLLQDDEEAARAFTGESPELLKNPYYQDQRMD
ncbi:MAG: hypothetical protein ACI4FZ_00095 [Lachnospiraceae bacterium]